MTPEFTYSLSSSAKKEIELFLLGNAHFTLFQHPEWSEITNPQKKSCYYILKVSNKIEAFAIITEQFLGANILFGPLSINMDAALDAYTDIIHHYQKKHFGILEIQPPDLSENEFSNLINSLQNKFANIKLITGWSTMVIDFLKVKGSIMDTFSSNHKRAINKAIKEGLVVRQIKESEDISTFTVLYRNLYKYRKILMPFPNPEMVFNQIFHFFKTTGGGAILGVYKGNELLAGIIIGYHHNAMFYHFGASDRTFKIPLTHIAFYEAIKLGKSKGYTSFDLGGYSSFAKKEDQTYNINRFKEGFGATIKQYPPKIFIRLNKYAYTLRVVARKVNHGFKKILQ